MKKVQCISCGFEKQFEIKNMGCYRKNGFDFAWDISNGLKAIPVCETCRGKIKCHIDAIEELMKTELSYLNFHWDD